MSAVSSVGSSNDLLQYLQQLAAQNLQPSTAATSTTPTTPTTPAQDPDASSAAPQPHGHHHGGHHPKISSQLKDAITSALDSSDGTTDPNQVIQTAIENFLNPSNSPTANSTTANTSTPQPLTLSDPGSQQSAFAQALQSNGISPSQFRQDFSTALQSAQSQGTPIDFTQLFKNFPPGTTLDTTG